MTKPMTAEEARALIDVLNNYGQMDEEGIIVSVSRQAVHEAMEGLRTYADMLDRQTVDREAVRAVLRKWWEYHVEEYGLSAWADGQDEAIDAIIALMPAGNVVARELEWVRESYIWKASQTKHTYTITEYAGMDDGFMLEGIAPLKVGFASPEAAKAAAQAHYNDAISKAVKPAHVNETPKTEHASEPSQKGEHDGIEAVRVYLRDDLRRHEVRAPCFVSGQKAKDVRKLLTGLQPVPVPDGMVMVPREPTEAMLKAVTSYGMGATISPEAGGWPEYYRTCWKTMVTAAPTERGE